jgi:PKD repeat protein
VTFSSSGSVDPEGQPLTYAWTFGDGGTSNQANPTHVYSQPGPYTVQLTVSDGASNSHATPIVISVGALPVGTITSPINGATFRAGDVIAFAGTATDAEDGTLTGASMTWTVLFHHDTHVHPAVAPLSGTTNGSFTIQTSGHDFSGTTNYEIILTVRDSQGLESTSSVTIVPEKVNLTFTTNPSGLSITIDGISHTTPYVHDTLVGFQHVVDAPGQVSGTWNYTFSSWSDTGTQSHTILVPAAPQTYIATFTATGPTLPPGLVAGYSFSEGGGTTTQDASGNSLAGTISGASWSTQGKYGSALSFDGVNDLVSVADAPALDLTTGMTLAAWVFPTVTTGVREVVIKEGSGVDIYNLYASNGTRPEANVFVGGSNRTAIGTAALPANTWTYIASTYDGATVRLYLNGAQVASTSITGSIATSTGALRIGGNSLWGEFFQGRIDEVRIYNRALTASEITTDMNTPLGAGTGDTTPPVVSNGLPTGALAAGTTQTTLSVTTNEVATCRYGPTAGTAYTSLPTVFTTTGGTTHTSPLTGLVNGGSYTRYVKCQDGANNANTTDTVIAFSVALPGDTTAPTVTMTAPTPGTVTGTVTVSANASDNVGIVGVQFLLNGAPLGAEDTSAPYSINWNTTGTANGGPYQVSARARDAANNQTTATAVSVTVNNPVTGLVAAYAFNEGSGTTTQSPSGLNGTISGATWSTQGKFGNALSFDGVNDSVTVADANALDLTTGMTLEAWVFPTAAGGGTWRNVLIKERSGGEVYNLYSNTVGNVPQVYVVRSAQTGTPLEASGTAAVPPNAWTHLAATFNGSMLRLYVNGTQVGTRAVSGALLTSTGALRIGGNSIWGEYFQGRIDEVRIYNRALTATEIANDMNTPLP